MQDIVIRPSMKFIKAGYAITLLLIGAAFAVHYLYIAPERPGPPWLPIASLILLVWPIKRHLQRQTVKLTIAGDKMRYEVGFVSKSTRIIQLPKVQDVRVVQSFFQRIFGVGDISIETAGENSRLVVQNLDEPRQLAEQITDASARPSDTGVH
jgi:uncharacterized membrane protein YdbT with pleckstrin-like domain